MNDFTKGSIWKHLIFFAWPMFIGSLFQQLYSITDSAIVGIYVGSNAFAAIGASTPIINITTPVMIGLTNGASILISQYYGSKRTEDIQQVVATSLYALGLAALCCAIAGVLLSPWILQLTSTPLDIMANATEYLRITFVGILFMMVYNMYASFMRALGDSKAPLAFLALSGILNIGLDLLFVLAFRLGVAGVAWATLISQALAALACMLYAKRKLPLIDVGRLAFDWNTFRKIMSYGIPNALQISLTSWMGLSVQNVVNGLGTISIAGITAANKVDSLVYMPITSLSNAASTMVAQNIGAENEERAKQVLYKSLGIMAVLSIVMSAGVYLLRANLVGLFFSGDALDNIIVNDIGAGNLAITSLFYSLFALFYAFSGFYRGAGDAWFTMFLSMASLLVRMLSAYYMVYSLHMEASAMAWSIVCGWSFTCVCALAYYATGKWRGKAAKRKA